jgi:tRNA(fMet)-specific endonuclease VapC
MKIYIFDTDHLNFYGRNNSAIMRRLLSANARLITTAINLEEQMKGRLAQIAEAQDEMMKLTAYQRLVETVMFLSEFIILQYSAKSYNIYEKLRKEYICVGNQDLRIASITLANNGILLTKNKQNFNKIPGLIIEDWSI